MHLSVPFVNLSFDHARDRAYHICFHLINKYGLLKMSYLTVVMTLLVLKMNGSCLLSYLFFV
jgi:hypothetical protein